MYMLFSSSLLGLAEMRYIALNVCRSALEFGYVMRYEIRLLHTLMIFGHGNEAMTHGHAAFFIRNSSLSEQ